MGERASAGQRRDGVHGGDTPGAQPAGRGLHSSSSQLNLRHCWPLKYCNHPPYPQKVLMLSRKVDECKSLPAGRQGQPVLHQPRVRVGQPAAHAGTGMMREAVSAMWRSTCKPYPCDECLGG